MPDLFFYQKEKSDFITKPLDKNIKYKVIKKFNKLDNEWIANCHEKYDFYIQKDYKFLNWRFSNHPLNNYKCIILDKGRGYVILKPFFEKNNTKLHMVDYAYLETPDLVKLLKIVDNYAYDIKANFINFWGFNSNLESKIFKSLNYNLTPSYNRLILHSDIKFSHNEVCNWHIVLGDNDVY